MEPARISRRDLITAGAAAGVVALAPRAARAQPKPAEPPSVITTPPRDFGPNAPPNVYFVDPDVITVDPAFNGLRQVNAPIQRLWTGALWSEGPAWSGQGRYLVWSDIPNNRQMRWLEDDGRVSVFRMPSNNSNGNTFDFQGRQLSCEHLTRRVVRYEHDGSITLIADGYSGKRLNSPNDVVPHPDGSYWFTDPPYGVNYQGYTDQRLKMQGDDMNPEQFRQFLGDIFSSYRRIVKADASLYVCHSSSWQREFQNALEAAGFAMRCQLIWAKNTFAWGFGRYKFQHEPIFYAYVAGQKDPWYGDKSQSTLWEEKKPAANRIHPTAKPVELVERALVNSSRAGDVVVDLFGGSGSTLIGCERKGRTARLMEIDPIYTDCIVRRWQEYTGKCAVLEGDGASFDEISRRRLKDLA